MFTVLLKHQFKETGRSLMRHTNMVANILISLLFIIMFLNFSLFGIFIYDILKDAFPDKDPVVLFNGLLLYYFLVMVVLRFLMQPIPALTVRPYLLLPVKKPTLVHYLVVKSLFNVFNLLPMLIFIPFALKSMILQGQAVTGIFWLATLFTVVLCNSLIILFLNKKIVSNPKWLLVPVCGLAAVWLLEKYNLFSLVFLSAKTFNAVVDFSALFLAAVVLFGLLYTLNYNYLRRRLHVGDLAAMSGRKSRDMTSFSFLSRYGEVGNYIALELKLLWRNKRTRAMLIMAVSILPLGFLVYKNITFEDDFYLRPNPQRLTAVRRQADQAAVTLKVTTDSLPKHAHHVFIAGNQDNIGRWRPEKTPLFFTTDSSWGRTFYFSPGTDLRYKFTLGRWGTEALTSAGAVPEPWRIRVTGDTTIVHHVNAWMVPVRPAVFDINLVYMGIFFTGIIVLFLGQFYFSFSGGFFELLASRRILMPVYFRAKYYLMVAGAVVCWAICFVYAIFNIKIVYLNTALLLYNIGINTFVFMFMATLTRKKMDLNSGLFSQQGRGGVQMLMILPMAAVPIAIHMIIRSMGYPNLGFYVLGGLGLTGMLCHRILFKVFLDLYARQKYAMINGFRHTGD